MGPQAQPGSSGPAGRHENRRRPRPRPTARRGGHRGGRGARALDRRRYYRDPAGSAERFHDGCGEWISSVELENVLEAAVVAIPDERYSERPLACVVRAPDIDPDGLRQHLAGRVAKWWIPDAFTFIDEVPKTSVGKFDKKVLRSRLAEGDLAVEVDS